MALTISARSHRLVIMTLVCLLGAAVVLSGGVAADGFDIEIDEINPDPIDVDEDDEVDVSFTVTNTADFADEQEVNVTIGDSENDPLPSGTEVELDAGNTTEDEITFDVDEIDQSEYEDDSTITLFVVSDDGDDSAVVDIDWVNFVVDEFDVTPDEVGPNTSVTFDARIVNEGSKTATQDIELLNDSDNQINSTSITLDGSDSEAVEFIETAPTDPDEYEYSVESDNDSSTTTLTVLEPASFAVTIEDVSVSGSALSLDAVIENEGSFEDTQTIVFSIDDEEIQTQSLTLGSGETESISFSYDTESEPFNVSAKIESELQTDSTAIASTTIEEGPTIETIIPSTVQGAEEVEINYTAVGDDLETVSLEVTDPNGDTFVDRSGTEVDREVDEGEGQIESVEMPPREELIEGEYEVTISVKDRFGGTDSDTGQFTADTVFNPEDVSSDAVYRSPAGDFVEITLDVEENLDEVYVLIGGDAEAGERNLQNYFDLLHIEATDDDLDEARFVINTRLVGADVPSEDVYFPVSGVDEENIEVTSYAHELGADEEPPDDGKFSDVTFQNERGNTVASTLADFRTELGLHSRSSPLQADRYRIVVGGNGNVLLRDDDIPDFKQAIERANIDLTQPEIQAANTYVLPPGPADKLDRFEDTDVENPDEDEFLETDDLGTLLDQATERETIAQGDRLLIEVQATGMFGALMEGENNHPVLNDEIEAGAGDGEERSRITNEQVETLLNRHEGVSIELTDVRLGGANHPGATLQFSDVDESDLYVVPDDSTDQWESDRSVGDDPQIGGFYIVVDTRGSTPFDRQPRHEDELQFEIAYESPDGERYSYEEEPLASGEKPEPFSPAVTEEDGLEHFPYFGSSDTTISANSTIEFLEPSVRYDRTIPDGDLVVPAQEDGRIIGSTNIAPGSDVTIQLIASNRPNPELIAVEDVEIDEDGRFDVAADFSDIPQGERIEVEFYTPGRTIDSRVIDKRGAYVVEDFENPATFEIDAITDEIEVEQRASLSEMRATINNTGDVVDRQTIEFTVGNDTLKSESVTLQSGQTTTLDLSDRFVTLPVGEYEYTVETDDDEATGELIVTAPDSGTEITSEDSDTAASESPLGDDELPGDDTDDGLFAFVGVTSRDVAVATAVAGLVHVLGSFT